MPKSVSDEQLFVFVPTGNDTVAGIFKINLNDFDKNSLPVLTIKQDVTVKENGTGFVRGGAVYSFVKVTEEGLQGQINDLKANKQNKTDNNLNTDHKDVVGAINETLGIAKGAKSVADTAASDLVQVKTLVNTANETANAASETANDAKDKVNALSKTVENHTTAIGANTAAIAKASSDIEALQGRATALETESEQHSQEIADLMTEDGNLRKDINTNSGNIATQGTAIEKNTNDIKALQDAAYGGETPIGTYPSATTLPTSEQLTAFVQQEVSRAPKLGDVVLFTQIVTSGTDKSYKFMYTATGWSNYVIPTVESATNTDKGILQGTLNDTSGNVQVSIIAGKVADILVKDGSTYKSIKTLLDNLATSIANTNSTVAANKTAADQGIAEAKAAAAAVVKKYNNVEFTLVSSTDNTLTNFPCKYSATIEGVTINNVADVYFSAVQIPLEIFSSYVQVEANKVSIFATVKTNYPTSVTVPTVRIS
jgi:hypothetical protein